MIKASKPKAEGKDTAATFRLQSELVKKLKYIALMDDTSQTGIIEGFLVDYIAKWEKKNGPIPIK